MGLSIDISSLTSSSLQFQFKSVYNTSLLAGFLDELHSTTELDFQVSHWSAVPKIWVYDGESFLAEMMMPSVDFDYYTYAGLLEYWYPPYQNIAFRKLQPGVWIPEQ